MSQAVTPARRALLAKVHLAAKGLALAEDSYRALLLRVGGAASAASIDEPGLVRVVEEFKRLGWKDSRRPFKPSADPQVRLIWALWAQLAPEGVRDRKAALRGFCRRVTGVEQPEWLSSEQANKVIEGLKARIARGAGAA